MERATVTASPFDRDSRLAFQFRRTFRRHRSLNPMAVNRCNYASQLTATAVNNVHYPPLDLHIHPFAFKILIEVCTRGISLRSIVNLESEIFSGCLWLFHEEISLRDEVDHYLNVVRSDGKIFARLFFFFFLRIIYKVVEFGNSFYYFYEKNRYEDYRMIHQLYIKNTIDLV